MQLKVYYVDDETDLLEMFQETYSTPEILINVFSDPQLALRTIESDPPDLIFLDYRLPNTTGDRMALQMSPGIRKALITGDLSVKLEAHFEKIFEKPTSPAMIEEYLQSVLADKRKS